MHVLAVIVVLFVFIVAVVGSMFSATIQKKEGGDAWKNFPRSPYTPPSWVFSAMWTFLYITIAYSWYKIANLAGMQQAEAVANGVTPNKLIALNLLLFVNMALNLSWTFVYLGLRSAAGALAIIVTMALTLIPVLYILTTIEGMVVEIVFLGIYLAWLVFASLLNAYSVFARQ